MNDLCPNRTSSFLFLCLCFMGLKVGNSIPLPSPENFPQLPSIPEKWPHQTLAWGKRTALSTQPLTETLACSRQSLLSVAPQEETTFLPFPLAVFTFSSAFHFLCN